MQCCSRGLTERAARDDPQFVVCRGIPVLVQVLTESRYREHKALQLATLDCILAIVAVAVREQRTAPWQMFPLAR